LELTGATFGKHVDRNDIPVLVDFWAPWCGPCKTMAPQFVKAAHLLEPELRLAKVDVEAEPGLGSQYGIRAIPTLIVFKNGRELARHSGALAAESIVDWTRGQLRKAVSP
jgi:thioredoxin 2